MIVGTVGNVNCRIFSCNVLQELGTICLLCLW